MDGQTEDIPGVFLRPSFFLYTPILHNNSPLHLIIISISLSNSLILLLILLIPLLLSLPFSLILTLLIHLHTNTMYVSTLPYSIAHTCTYTTPTPSLHHYLLQHTPCFPEYSSYSHPPPSNRALTISLHNSPTTSISRSAAKVIANRDMRYPPT